MKKWYVAFIQFVVVSFLGLSMVSAAPNIDGYMYYTSQNDWGGLGTNTVKEFSGNFSPYTSLTNVSVEYGDSYGSSYDVEELGVYIDNNMLYIGIQTDYDLSTSPNSSGVEAGDFIFNFDESSANFYQDNRDTDDFALDFSIKSNGSVDMTLLAGNLVSGTNTTDINNYGKTWEIVSADSSQTFANAGKFTENYSDSNGYYTLEAAIDLSQLSNQLATLFTGYAANNDSVTMYWQPSCGNDFLAARSDFSYNPPDFNNPIPEPATLLLFGIGLLGASSLGRRRHRRN